VRLKRTIRITLTQVHSVSHVAAGGPQSRWCPRCADFVAMLTPEQAASLAGVSTRHVFRWLEADRLHFVETTSPSPLVCMASLPSAGGGSSGSKGVTAAGDE